jgi:hypothetical protein
MFQLLQKIIRWLKGWLVIRPRSFIKLLSHKELYDTVSYFPEQSKHRRTTRQIFLDQCQSIVKYGSPNKYYFPYGLDVKSKKTHEEYVHFDYFFKRLCHLNLSSPVNCCCILRDKILFNIFANGIGIKTPQNIFYSSNGKIYDFHTKKELSANDLMKLNGCELFCKIIDGECGKGIFKLTIQNDQCLMNGQPKDVNEVWKILTAGRYLAQNVIKQHELLASLHPQSINTLRVITVKSLKDGVIRVFPSILRIGTGDSIVDNTSQGGICVGIDLDTAYLKKYGFYKPQYGRKVSCHPDSGIMFEQFQIPFLQQAIEQALYFHSMLPGMHSVGWDIAVEENGPIFIEGNDNWEINGPQICNGGLRHLFDAYFFGKKG